MKYTVPVLTIPDLSSEHITYLKIFDTIFSALKVFISILCRIKLVYFKSFRSKNLGEDGNRQRQYKHRRKIGINK